MFVNHAAFEEGQRHQQITTYKVCPFQSSEQEDYQVLVENIPSLFKEDLRMIHNKEEIPFWVEEKGKAWTKLAKLKVNTPQLLFALGGDHSAKSESNGDNTFIFFDDFVGVDAPEETHRSTTQDGVGGVNHIEYVNTYVIKGNYCYCAVYGEDTLTILNISNPDSVSETGYVACGGAHDIKLKEISGTLYAFVVAYAGHDLISFNVNNPASPSQVGTIDVGGTNGMYLMVDGDYAYVSVWDSGTANNNCIKIYNISDPANITYVSQVCHNGTTCLMRKPWCMAKKGNYIYLASTTDSRIHIIDVSNVNSPSYDSYFQSTNVGIDPLVWGDYLFTTNSNPGEVIIWDISTPNSPSQISKKDFDIWYHMDLDDNGEYLYVRRSDDLGINIIDVSDKSNMYLAGSILNSTYSYFNHVHFSRIVNNTRLYSFSYTNDRLFIFDIAETGRRIDDAKWEHDTTQVSFANGIATLAGGSKHIHGIPNVTLPFVAEMRVKASSGGYNGTSFGTGDAPHAVYPYTPNNGVFYYTRSAYSGDVQGKCATAWMDPVPEITVEADLEVYQVRKFVQTATNIKVYYNDILEINHSTDIPTVAQNIWFNSVTSSDILADWAFIRKYALSEPLIIKKRVSGKADVIKAIVSGLVP